MVLVGEKQFGHHFPYFRVLCISLSLWSEISKVVTEYLDYLYFVIAIKMVRFIRILKLDDL